MLQEVVDDYIAALSKRKFERSGSPNTAMAYRNDLNQLCGYIMSQKVEDWSQVTREQIAAYLLEMREGQAYRPATIARKIAAFKSFFRYLHEKGLIDPDPVEHIDTPRIQKGLPQILSPEQVNRLFAQVAEDTPGGLRDLAMLHVLYSTGMRVTELISLNMADFQPEQATMHCPASGRQAKRDRILPLSVAALDVTLRYREQARSHFLRSAEETALFLNHHGERLTRQGFWLIIKGYARQVDIMSITPHMLRHSFAILMLNEGMELRSVQQLLGHAHISTTQIYSQMAHIRPPGADCGSQT